MGESVSAATMTSVHQTGTTGRHHSHHRQGLTLLQLTELMKQEAQASGQPVAADQPLPCKLPSCAATPLQDSNGAGQPVEQQQQPGPGPPDCSRCSGDAGTPTLSSADGPCRSSTLDSLQSLQSAAAGAGEGPTAQPALTACPPQALARAAAPLGKAASLPLTLEPSPARPRLLRPSSGPPVVKGVGLRNCRVSEDQLQQLELAGGRPVRVVGLFLSEQLERTCFKAVRFLANLQRPGYCRITGNPAGPLMPKTVLRFSKGLAFLWEHKVGLVGAWTWGGGFVVARLPGGGWSAPSFVKCHHMSFGLSLGYQRAKYCYAIATKEALDAFKEDNVGIDLDSTMPLGRDQLDPHTPPAKAVAAPPLTHKPPGEGSQPRTYLMASGFMINLAIRCGLTCVDEDLNETLYGKGTTASQILAGEVQHPKEFEPLYEVITKLATEAPVVKTAKSMFQLCKQQSEERLAKLARGSARHKSRSLASSINGGGLATNDNTASTRAGLRRASTDSQATLRSLAPLSAFTSLFPEVTDVTERAEAGVSPAVGQGKGGGEGWEQQQEPGSGFLLFGDVELPPEEVVEEGAAGAGAGADTPEERGQQPGSPAVQQQGERAGHWPVP